MQCKAGGNLLPDAGEDEHLQGTVLEFEIFLKDKESNLSLLILFAKNGQVKS